MGGIPAPLARVVAELSKLPGIGEKTATRLAFHLLRTDAAKVEALVRALSDLHREMRICSICCALAGSDPCDLCSDPGRSREIVCVVEESADMVAVERTGSFRGVYHVLNGTLAPLDGIGPNDLHVNELLRRLEGGQVREVILATNPTPEGSSTALYLAQLIKPLGVRVTRIAHGLPLGGDVEYADSGTIALALDGRREL